MTRLEKQLGFLLECDRMKSIYRQTYILADESRGASMREFEGDAEKHARRENDAEHSFHLVLFAMILSEYSNEPVDLLKVINDPNLTEFQYLVDGDNWIGTESGAGNGKDH